MPLASWIFNFQKPDAKKICEDGKTYPSVQAMTIRVSPKITGMPQKEPVIEVDKKEKPISTLLNMKKQGLKAKNLDLYRSWINKKMLQN